LTLKKEQCKNKAQAGSIFCGRHKDCANPFSTKTEIKEKAQTEAITSIIQIPKLPERLKDTATIPTDLAEKVAKDIVTKVNNGLTAESATAKTLDDLVVELGFTDIADLTDLTEAEIDYFISTILLHENQDKLSDIIQKKIDEQSIKDPHAKLIIKTRELLQELAAKFCRCIKKVLDKADNKMTENIAVAICRKGVINSRGLSIPRFSCKTYPDPSNKSKYEDTPIFLPSKDRKKLLSLHPGYQLYLSKVIKGDLKKWEELSKAEKDQYFKKV